MEQVDIGSSGLFAQGSFTYGLTYPGGVLKPLHLKGDSYVGTAEAGLSGHSPAPDQPDPGWRRVEFDSVDQSTDFPGNLVLEDDHLRIIWARADTVGEHEFETPVLSDLIRIDGDMSLEIRQGLHILGASADGAPTLSRIDGRSDAFVFRSEGHVALHADPIDGGLLPLTLSVHFQGQWSNLPLLSYEEQAIGNLTIGRGYGPSAATGDRAIAAEFKLETRFGPNQMIRPYAFFDVAHVSNLDFGSQDQTLRSVGAGIEFRFPHRLRADISYAQPLDQPLPGTPVPSGEVLVQLFATYF